VKAIRWLVWPAVLFLLACMPFSNLMGPFLYRGGFDAIDLSAAIILLALVGNEWVGRRFFEWKPLVKLGLVAYGFYLWHLTVFYVVSRVDTGWNYVLRVLVALAGTLAMTLLSWFLLERPLQRWVHKTAPRVQRTHGNSEVLPHPSDPHATSTE
jgi:peptidoglycan/LPS O-acetylase OafA/YrhL